MHFFEYKGGELHAENVPVRELVLQYGTPLYIYSAATLRRHFQAFDSAFDGVPHLTCYSVKANSNVNVLKVLAKEGAGMDIVSGGELHRALAAGVDPKKIVYSGVGKTEPEIAAALKAGILLFNAESFQELEAINRVAVGMGVKAGVGVRVNPDVDPKTHPYISTGMKKNKFGLPIEAAFEAYMAAKTMPGLHPIGLDCHIGSQLTTLAPFLEALGKIIAFSDRLKAAGIEITHLDLGGGLGITYNEEEPPHPTEFGHALVKVLKDHPMTVVLEPGRVIAGNSGVLVAQVVYTKPGVDKDFVVVDAAMNDLVRPSLYNSYHHIAEVAPKGRAPKPVDVVGPICESGDFLAKDRLLPEVVQGEFLAVFSAGAYGFSMSSQYNSRPRTAEVIVDGDAALLARKRETYADLIRLEMD